MTRTLPFLLTLLVVSSVGCARLEETAIQKAPDAAVRQMTFHATLADALETKTALQSDQKSIFWTPGDAINIFYGSNSAGMFSAQITEPSSTASFSGNIGVATGSANDDFVAPTFWGVYPYDSANTCDGRSVTLKIRGAQAASPGSFGIGMNPSIANSSGLGLSFYNVGSWLRFSVSQPGITSATFSGNAGEILAGNVTVTMDSDKKPFIINVADGQTSITVTPEGGGSFVPDTLYYVTLIPQKMAATGYTLTLYKGNQIAKCVVSKASGTYDFPRSGYRSKKNADAGLTWETISRGPLCFTAIESGTIALSNYGDNAPDVKYSTDGTSWASWDYSAITVPAGGKVYFKGNNGAGFSSSVNVYSSFMMTGKFAASGSIQSLLYGDDFEENLTIPDGQRCFVRLFNNCSALTTAPELPATSLSPTCYFNMFTGCTSLTSAPKLPATILAYSCYANMFSGCTSLTSAPDLPSTTAAERCYQYMFHGCTGLTSAPELPAKTMADYCYQFMFYGCTGLTSAPELPATTLASDCYNCMFSGCTGLTSAPSLPATTLASSCYSGMFSGCAGLTSAPELPATTLAPSCYHNMFSGCTGLTSAPKLPATTLTDYCYSNMFGGCVSLTSVPSLPATTLTDYCYSNMFGGCVSLTSAPSLPATTLAPSCYLSMFSGCTSLTSAPSLPATTLASSCYSGMFSGCAGLTSVPSLPATTLASSCYNSMFFGCTGLTSAPSLLATTLTTNCYQNMFRGCSNLAYVMIMATDNSASGCLTNWLRGVSSMGTFVKNKATTFETGADGIPEGWTVLNYVE